MKRHNNLFEKIICVKNLQEADMKARRGKLHQYGVRKHDRNREENIIKLHYRLKNKTYRTSQYKIFKVYEPKERDVYSLPYIDRIVHWAIMLQVEKLFVATFTADTFSCIKKRGIHGMNRAIKKSLQNVDETQYCLKLDITKFYPNIDHDILKTLIRKKIKDRDLLLLLDEIIDSAKGVPIGNYCSQIFANFYLCYFDHWMKEVMKVKDYFRYADDIVALASTKPILHQLLFEIKKYLSERLKLTVKDNYQIFNVDIRGIDVGGYVYRHTHILLRPTIKHNCFITMSKRPNKESMASYNGWIKWCNGINLSNKLQLMYGNN